MTPNLKAVQFAGMRPLRAWLKRHSITLPEFAERTGLEVASLYRLKNGQRSYVSVDMAFRIEDATEGEVPARRWCRAPRGGSALDPTKADRQPATEATTDSAIDPVQARIDFLDTLLARSRRVVERARGHLHELDDVLRERAVTMSEEPPKIAAPSRVTNGGAR